jgi:hypothetical protein
MGTSDDGFQHSDLPTRKLEFMGSSTAEFNAPAELFCFTKLSYAVRFLKEGHVSFGQAALYSDSALTAAQRDEERTKHCELGGERVIIRTGATYQSATVVPDVSSIRISATLPLYYIRCFSASFDSGMFPKFESDACVHVKDAWTFLIRLERAFRQPQLLLKWRFKGGPVKYVPKSALLLPEEEEFFPFRKDKVQYGDQGSFV